MEIFRSLGALVEPPAPELRPLAELLELGPLPDAGEHTDLFTFQLYPYASVYLDPRGMLGGEARDRVAGFWRALGLDPPSEPDHLAVMLAFHAELCERSRGTRHRDRWLQVRKAHLWEHLLPWLPVYLSRLGELTPPFYRRWSRLLHDALRAETETFGPQERPALHLRSAPGMADPRADGLEVFLDALLSPIRSGVIWVRDDLVTAARELGLGARAGERRFVLEALLGQDSPATLGWLAGRSRQWADRLRGQEPIWESVTSFWIARAEATASLLDELGKTTGDEE